MFFDVVVPLLGFAAVAWVLRSKINGMRDRRDALAGLASALGLSPAGTARPLTAEEQKDLASSAIGRAGLAAVHALPAAQRAEYAGQVEGVRVRVRLVSEHKGRTVLTDLFAMPDRPWSLGLHIEREHQMDHILQPKRQARDVITGDAEFDRTVFVESSNPAVAEQLLRGAELRQAIAVFVGSHGRAGSPMMGFICSCWARRPDWRWSGPFSATWRGWSPRSILSFRGTDFLRNGRWRWFVPAELPQVAWRCSVRARDPRQSSFSGSRVR